MNLNLKLPSIATTIIGAGLAVVVALNDQVFHFGPPWTTGITMAVVWAGVFGVSLLSGKVFQTVVQVTQGEAAGISGALSVVQLLLMQADATSWLKTALQCVVVIGGTLGFGVNTALNVKADRHPGPGARHSSLS